MTRTRRTRPGRPSEGMPEALIGWATGRLEEQLEGSGILRPRVLWDGDWQTVVPPGQADACCGEDMLVAPIAVVGHCRWEDGSWVFDGEPTRGLLCLSRHVEHYAYDEVATWHFVPIGRPPVTWWDDEQGWAQMGPLLAGLLRD